MQNTEGMKKKPIKDQIFLVTGATDGIGKVTAEEIAKKDATVILIGRNPEKTKSVTEAIRETTGNNKVDHFIADLSSQEQIHKLVENYSERYPHCDVLINNAGALFTSRQESIDGIEMTFALNHLNYFLLTHLMLPKMPTDSPARIINVSSMAHQSGSINFNDIQHKNFYNGWGAYAQSKLANILFTYELARKLEAGNITTNTLHPGIVATKFGANNGFMGSVLRSAMNLISISAEDGAKTQIYLATSDEVEGISGKYYDNCTQAGTSRESNNTDIAHKLWELSLSMTELKEPYGKLAA
jgi:NAD(P)-dependent dehydrogenase (short-subunit alcohol dehydrogenase family)